MAGLTADITVNGVTIPAARIAAEAQNHPAPKGKPGIAWTAAARALALRELMLEKARALGLQAEPGEIAPGRMETEDEALIRAVLEAEVRPAPVAEAELRAAYDARPDRFHSPTLWEASHILFAAEPGPQRAEARVLADKVLAEILARPASFADLALAHSACSSRQNGGRLGQLGPGDTVPEFERALAALTPGEIAAAPVETPFGWHILRQDARAEGAVLPFAAVLPRLREAAEKAAWTRAAHDFAERLIAGAQIEGVRLTPEPARETQPT